MTGVPLRLLVAVWLMLAAGCQTASSAPEDTGSAPPVQKEATSTESAPEIKGADPSLNARYFDQPDVEQWRERFERESREIWSEREEILKRVGVRPGMAVADIGTGTGFFAVMFARQVGENGKAYGVDIVPEFVKNIGDLAKKYQLENLEGVQCETDSVSLPAASIDLAFLCDVYHHFEHPGRSLQSIHQALRPGGELVVIDFIREEGKSSEFILGHVRADEATFTAEIESAGFERVERSVFLEENYFLRFRRK